MVGGPQKFMNESKGDEAILVGESQPEEIVLTSRGKENTLKVFDYGMRK